MRSSKFTLASRSCHNHFLSFFYIVLLHVSLPVTPQHPFISSGVPAVNSILRQVTLAQNASDAPRAYRVFRKYKVFPSNNPGAAYEALAAVELNTSGQKSYTIQKGSGNRRVDQVVRQILDREVQASLEGRQLPTAALLEGNYDAAYVGEESVESHKCYVLRLTPKRNDKKLIIGRAWVDRDRFLVRKIDGDLARSPSWWIKKAHVTFVFGDVTSIWMQTSSRVVADVRVFGSHTLISETLPQTLAAGYSNSQR